MSCNIYKVPGRNITYMPVDLNASKDEILELYARQSFSTENTWPYPSPLAGYYDVKNSDTKLILLNNRRTYSHLRGKTSARPAQSANKKDEYYDWVEREHQMKKLQEERGYSNRRAQSTKSKRSADPSRHFSHVGCTYKASYDDSFSNYSARFVKPTSSQSARSHVTATVTHKKVMSKEEEEDLLQYLISIGKRTAGLQEKTNESRPPSEFKSSYNINHPNFNRDQRLYLKSLCNAYSIKTIKQAKQEQYLKILQKQKAIDFNKKEKYKLHPADDFDSYQTFISVPRPVPAPVNCGYADPRKPKRVSSFKTYNYESMPSFQTDYKAKESLNESINKDYAPPKLIDVYFSERRDEEIDSSSTIVKKNNDEFSHEAFSSKSYHDESFEKPSQTSLSNKTSSIRQKESSSGGGKASNSSKNLNSSSSKSIRIKSSSSIVQSKTSFESLSKQVSKNSIQSKKSNQYDSNNTVITLNDESTKEMSSKSSMRSSRRISKESSKRSSRSNSRRSSSGSESRMGDRTSRTRTTSGSQSKRSHYSKMSTSLTSRSRHSSTDSNHHR